MFVENRITLPAGFDDDKLAGKKWKQLDIEYKKIFWNYVIPVDQFDVVEDAVIDEMFDRLNRNSRKLERQELRHAKFDGWLIGFAEELSLYSEKLKELKVVTGGRARRMKDVQFISELIIMVLKKEISGFDQDMIDEFYAGYDDPDNEVANFDSEAFEEKFKEYIDYLYQMNQHNDCVLHYATTFGNLYSLFSLISLHGDLRPAEDIANAYAAFMEEFKEYGDTAKSEEPNIISYSKNSTGASTEAPQRLVRFEALKKYIFEK